MSEPFLAEVKIVGFNFAPRGWATCDGQILPISQNAALFSLVGTTYGGDGRTTFALPDLRGRTPIHTSSDHPLGQRAGSETHALSTAEMPAHTHAAQASENDATSGDPTDLVFGRATTPFYGPPTSPASLAPEAVSEAGSGAGHPNMQPYTVLNYVIALQGLFPSRD